MPKDKTTPPRSSAASSKLNRTEQRQKERQKEQRRQRVIYAAIGIVVLVAIAAVILFFTNTPAEAPIPDTAGRYDDLSQVVTDKGYPRIGSLDGIAVTLYTAFACDTCRTFQNDVIPALIERVRADDISLTFVPLRGGNISNPNGAARSALCAGQQARFFQYTDSLYHWLDLYSGDAFRDNRLTTGASNLGLDMSLFNQCRTSAPENAVYNAAAVDLTGVANASTPPLVRVNNILLESTDLETINTAIDAALAFRAGTTTDDETAGDSEPTDEPAVAPTLEATDAATQAPTSEPTAEPTESSTDVPATQPAVEPTATGS